MVLGSITKGLAIEVRARSRPYGWVSTEVVLAGPQCWSYCLRNAVTGGWFEFEDQAIVSSCYDVYCPQQLGANMALRVLVMYRTGIER